MNRTILLVLLVACGVAQAAEWVSVITDKAETEEQQVDVSSIMISGGTRLAWVKTLVALHSQHGAGTSASKWIAYKLGRMEFNCRQEAFRVGDIYVYFEDGTVDPAPSATPDLWVAAPPDSVVATIMRFTCSWKPK
jgi:hypothetical protein